MITATSVGSGWMGESIGIWVDEWMVGRVNG